MWIEIFFIASSQAPANTVATVIFLASVSVAIFLGGRRVVALLKNYKMPSGFGLIGVITICVVMLLPFLTGVFIIEKTKNEEIDFTRAEYSGVAYTQALMELMIAVQNYREQIMDAGENAHGSLVSSSIKDDIAAKVKAIDKLDKINIDLGLS